MTDQHPALWKVDIKKAQYHSVKTIKIIDANWNTVVPAQNVMPGNELETIKSIYDRIVAAVNACDEVSNIDVDAIDKLKDRIRPAMLMCASLGLDAEAKFLAEISSVAFGIHRIMFIVKSLLPDTQNLSVIKKERLGDEDC